MPEVEIKIQKKSGEARKEKVRSATGGEKKGGKKPRHRRGKKEIIGFCRAEQGR
ncbi:MAG: hypothetical protein KAI67_05365 [Candidatus Pacebacteria bacterium]|nr:hypothetical protein [Candidatus Paceibacterota bacterium]